MNHVERDGRAELGPPLCHIIVHRNNLLDNLTVTSEHIPPTEVPLHVKQKIEEKHKIEAEIRKGCAILEQKNVDVQTIEGYEKLEEELQKYGLTMESPRKLISVLSSINQIGYDSLKIVKELARIKSLKRLKNECKALESRITKYKEIIPLCEQIKRLGIRFSELAAFHTAVMKKGDLEKICYDTAAYALMDGIDTSDKLIDARKQLNDNISKRKIHIGS